MIIDYDKPLNLVKPVIAEVPVLGLRVIARDSGIGYLSFLAMMALGVVTKILLARALSPVEFGLLITGQTIVGLALTLAQLSLPDTVVRFVGHSAGRDMPRAKGVLANALQLSLSGSGLMALGLGLSASLIAEGIYRQAALAGVLVLLALAMPMSTAASILAAAYRGIGQLWVKILYVDLVPAVWIVVALGLLVILDGNSLLAIAGVYVIAAALSASLTFGLFRRGPQWRAHETTVPASELLQYSLPLLGASLLVWPISAIPLLLGRLGSLRLVAYYSVALSLSSFVYASISAAEMAALPVWSSQIANGVTPKLRADYAFTTRWCFIIASTVFAVLFFHAETVLAMLFGPDYTVAVPAVQAVAMVFLLNAVTGPNESLLRALGSTRWIFLTRLAVGAVALVGAFPLIRFWGLVGAVIAYLFSVLTGISLYAGYLFWRYDIHPLDRPYLKTLAVSVIALIITGLVQQLVGEGIGMWKMLSTLSLYTALLFGLLYGLRAFTPRDWHLVGSAYRQVRHLLSKD